MTEILDRCPITGKIQFELVEDAIAYQCEKFPDVLFRVYTCPKCQMFHITTKGLGKYSSMMLRASRLIQSRKSTPIQSISNTRVLHEVKIDNECLVVLYDKRNKKALKIL